MEWSKFLTITIACLELSVIRPREIGVKSRDTYHTDGTFMGDKKARRYQRSGGLPGGCVLDNGKFVNFGDTYRGTHYVFRCEKLNRTHVRLIPVKCLTYESELDAGESVRTASFVVTCSHKRGRITGLTVNACVGDSGYAVAFGKTFKKDNFLFRCVKKDGQAYHSPIGCVIHGTAVGISETLDVGDFWYKCDSYGENGIQTKVMGCVDSDEDRHYPGDKYRRDGYLYLCEQKGTEVTMAVVGCVEGDSEEGEEYLLGQSWYTKPLGGISYQVTCSGNGTTVRKEFNKCIVNLGNGRKAIEVGHCAKYGKNSVFLCWKEENGSIGAKLTSFPLEDIDTRYPVNVDGVECLKIDD